MELSSTHETFFIKANVSTNWSCLSFPSGFHRARKNSIDLFDEIILQKIKSVRQFENERAFALELENDLSLIFKMHGNKSNVLLLKQNKIQQIFKNQLKTDFEIDIDRLDTTIEFGKGNFEKNISRLRPVYFTLGSVVFDFLEEQNFDLLSSDEKWGVFNKTIERLKQPAYFVTEYGERLILSLLPLGKISKEFADPITALNFFADKTVRDHAFYTEKRQAISKLEAQLKNSKNYLDKNKRKLQEIENDHHYQLWADLLMANLHFVKQGKDEVVLNNFYDEKPIAIKLKKELSPQKNAEVFYRKAKNRQIEIEKLKEGISRKQTQEVKWHSTIESIRQAQDLKHLREIVNLSGVAKTADAKEAVLPYREFEFKSYKIWVGKNAEANDKLTLKYSFKEDLWLHAKDVAGSHVLIKHQSGKKIPKEVVEYAARLAAFYSKRKNESLCPVAYTPKKFVRKRKGDPAGAVVVEREEVILVEPLGVNS